MWVRWLQKNLNSFRGGFDGDFYWDKGKCLYPYQGNLCAECAEGYEKFGSKFRINFFQRQVLPIA